MSKPIWISLIVAYPFVLALIICWFQGVYHDDDDPGGEWPRLAPTAPGPRRSTMKIEALGREVARFEIIERQAPDGELLEFYVPPPETRHDWTIEQVAGLIAEIEAS
jgi:hypothetical protein